MTRKLYLTDIAEWEFACLEILQWWMRYAVDHTGKGFYGEISRENQPNPNAPKGLVMHARIMWSFATAYLYFSENQFLHMALLAENILEKYFHDHRYGGYYWKLNHNYTVSDNRKMLYGQAFVLYAYAALYRATQDANMLQRALRLWECIELHGSPNTFYTEGFDRSWKESVDPRLDKDEPLFQYSLNTHLHLMEAYSELYVTYPSASVLSRLQHVLHLICDQLYQDRHLIFWLNEKLKPIGNYYSPGHEIETAWLLLDTWEKIGKTHHLPPIIAYRLGDELLRNTHIDEGITEPTSALEKQWWVQAEAMTGFLHLYQHFLETRFLQAGMRMWKFIQEKFIDNTYGEWHWGLDKHNRVITHRYKAGFWKAPYHNVRALLHNIALSKDAKK
ncbi:MAG: AGE family epimerase/isomerase [Thermoflavifilum sp.]|nr:AGE family epimerase/isomerase [Thermoflavifilum sp.]